MVHTATAAWRFSRSLDEGALAMRTLGGTGTVTAIGSYSNLAHLAAFDGPRGGRLHGDLYGGPGPALFRQFVARIIALHVDWPYLYVQPEGHDMEVFHIESDQLRRLLPVPGIGAIDASTYRHLA